MQICWVPDHRPAKESQRDRFRHLTRGTSQPDWSKLGHTLHTRSINLELSRSCCFGRLPKVYWPSAPSSFSAKPTESADGFQSKRSVWHSEKVFEHLEANTRIKIYVPLPRTAPVNMTNTIRLYHEISRTFEIHISSLCTSSVFLRLQYFGIFRT